MSKHTRGPWRSISPNCEGGSIRIDAPGETRPVAYVDNGRRADAFLIAAAPDMLEMLKRVERCLSSPAMVGIFQIAEIHHVKYMGDVVGPDLRALIARVEGRA